MKSRTLKSLAFLFFLSLSCAKAQVTIIIESLPPTTQGKDTIFICGSFNNWVPNDKRYVVQKQLNGQLSVVVPMDAGVIEYKFTRGDWMRVETNSENKLIANRKFLPGKDKTVYVKIENWLDQGGARSLNYIVLFFFACAFQGIALCLLSLKIQKKDLKKISAFLFINTLMITLLLLLVVLEFSDPIWQEHLSFFFHFGMFCWGPSILLVIHSYLKPEIKFPSNYFGVPLGITLVFGTIQLFNSKWFNFLSAQVLPPITLGNLLFIGSGFLYNVFLFIRMTFFFPQLVFLKKEVSHTKIDLFLNTFYWFSLGTTILVAVNIVVLSFSDSRPFFEDFHMLGLAFTVLIFMEAFFIWRFPEILREVKPQPQAEDNSEWLIKLDQLMKSEKPYRNPDLSVADLSDMLGTKSHVLSKVINEHYDKNFRDFLNKYRVEEFIALANTSEFKHYTFLALAQEVGFNSKSTFNLAFKKLTNQNPRDYFKTHEVEE
ncbi:hypothetical protein WSM22_29710 [Cytophagales bacterium WSM2-2]|nr:hypothetical protein WSM22_29710 [Cytophagales bacterium WSM2-2]